MSQVITNAFEQYWQSSLAAEQPVVLDEFILADIPNLDITSPIDPDAGLPPESQIVHRQNVDQRGRINTNAVAYSIVMDTTVGDFSFNAMYLRNKANGVIGMIVYKGRETKLKTDQTTGQTGNSLVKSMLMGYDQAAEATLTHVDAGTWQIDYAARLRGQDEDLRQLASQLYGHHTFIGDGFKVVQQDGGHQVTPGVAIIGGLRVELKAPEVIYPGSKPIGVWVDVYRAGSLLSEHQNHFTIITSVADLTDHVDESGYQHYVAKLGTILADNTVVDGRGQGSGSGTGGIPDTFALWKRSMAEAGYNIIGRFGLSSTVTTVTDVLLYEAEGKAYSWGGTLPKTVPANSNPANSGGVGAGAWVDRSSLLLSDQTAKSVTRPEFAGGADRTGASSAVTAFQAAVNQTAGEKIYTPLYDTVPQAPWITIHVPTGKYLIDGRVYPNGKNVIWDCDAGVKFLGDIDNLCGRVVMGGVWINANSAASLNSAVGLAVSVNRGLGKPAPIMGITSPADLRSVPERDAVGLYADCESTTPTLTVASATYTATTATPSAPVDVRELLAGMIIDTDNGHSGVLETWAADGTSLTVKNGWYLVGGSSTPVIPPTAGFVVNQTTKVWGLNIQSILSASDTTTRSSGFELGLQNGKVDITDPSNKDAYVWGIDVCGLGPKTASIGYLQRNGILRGFESSGASKEGFVVSARNGVTPTSAFVSNCNAFEQITLRPNGTNAVFKVTNAGDIDVGALEYAGTKTMRFRSGGLTANYDTRLQSIGGAAFDGQGTLRIGALHTEVQGSIRPVTTNTSPCGTSSNAWSGGTTQTAFTVLSDERHKSVPLDITEAMLDAWGEVDWVQYQLLDRIEAKGTDGARWHFGVIAQRTVEAFARYGLDATRFAFLCYDEWDDQFETEQTNIGEFTIEKRIVSEPARRTIPAVNEDGSPVLDADGNPVTLTTTAMTHVEVEVQVPVEPVFETRLVTPAGNKYGIRYEEALALEAALQRRERERDRAAFESFKADVLGRLQLLEA